MQKVSIRVATDTANRACVRQGIVTELVYGPIGVSATASDMAGVCLTRVLRSDISFTDQAVSVVVNTLYSTIASQGELPFALTPCTIEDRISITFWAGMKLWDALQALQKIAGVRVLRNPDLSVVAPTAEEAEIFLKRHADDQGQTSISSRSWTLSLASMYNTLVSIDPNATDTVLVTEDVASLAALPLVEETIRSPAGQVQRTQGAFVPEPEVTIDAGAETRRDRRVRDAVRLQIVTPVAGAGLVLDFEAVLGSISVTANGGKRDVSVSVQGPDTPRGTKTLTDVIGGLQSQIEQLRGR